MHVMKLQEKYFNYIKYGTKIYEIRLNDEKRKNINKGDLIEFQKEPLKEEKIIYEVEDLEYFNDFKELTDKIDIKLLASSEETIQSLLDSLSKFYKKEDQDKYGVVAIKLKKNSNFIIEKNRVSTISSDNIIFKNVKNNYIDFEKWYLKLINNNEECYFTKKNKDISSILILKINENDSQQIDKKNILKIRTLNVLDTNKGIGKFYLHIVNDVALMNNINIIYVTCKTGNEEFIRFIINNDFKLYKEINDEIIFIKELL